MTPSLKNQSIAQKVFHHPIAIILCSTIAIILATVVVKELVSKPLLNLLPISTALVRTFTAIIGAVVMLATYKLLLKYYEKKSFSEFSLSYGIKESVLGFILGFGATALVVGLLYSMSYYQVLGMNSFMEFLPTMVFIFGAAILEEIIFRGLFFRILEQWKGPIIAIIISAVIFQLPHFQNSFTGILPGLLGVLFGLVTALIYADTRRLWLPIAFHFGWNIAQPIFGTTLSGVSEFTSLTDARLDGPEIFVGSGFGIEVSIFSFILLALIGLYYTKKLLKKGYFKKTNRVHNQA